MSEKDPILITLEDIKRLLILQLIKSRATSEEIGHALGVDSSTVRKMLPIKKIRRKTKAEQ